jgi:hypothetical protein
VAAAVAAGEAARRFCADAVVGAVILRANDDRAGDDIAVLLIVGGGGCPCWPRKAAAAVVSPASLLLTSRAASVSRTGTPAYVLAHTAGCVSRRSERPKPTPGAAFARPPPPPCCCCGAACARPWALALEAAVLTVATRGGATATEEEARLFVAAAGTRSLADDEPNATGARARSGERSLEDP